MAKIKPQIVIPILIVLGGGFLIVSRFISKSDFKYAGTIEATKVALPARLPTVISNMIAQEGQKVKKGDLLVSLDCEDLKVAFELINLNFKRAQSLFKSGSMSAENFDLTKNKKQEIDLKLSWCQINAPFDGTVLTRYKETGEYVTPGAKLLTLSDLESVWAILYVPATLISKLKIGMQIDAFLPELNQKPFKGTLARINDEAEFTPKNVQTRDERTRLVYGIKVLFNNPEQILKPGMTIEASLPEN